MGWLEAINARKMRRHADGPRAIAALIPETGSPPAIVHALPKPGLVEASVRTFHHPLLQNDYVTLSHDNPLGIGEKTVKAHLGRVYERIGFLTR